MIKKQTLVHLYFENKLSMAEIAKQLKVSEHKVQYWMEKHSLKRRSWSQATYCKRNPKGDPFSIKQITSTRQVFLQGLGLGLYWGEGTKADKFSVRISNSDPFFIQIFIKFLREIYQINEKKLRFALHIFSDINPEKTQKYWCQRLNISPAQFFKTQVINLKRKGTYKKKSKYGVLTLIFSNKKLRDHLIGELTKIESSCS